MALKALSLDRQIRYVSDGDSAKGTEREAQEATFFVLGAIPQRVMNLIKDGATTWRQKVGAEKQKGDKHVEGEFHANQANYDMVQFGLKGWENFLAPEGEGQVEFKTIRRVLGGEEYMVVHPDCMERLGTELVRELGEQLDELNGASAADTKG